MKIAILSFFSGRVERGVENWASVLKKRLSSKIDIEIISGKSGESLLAHAVKTFKRWSKADIVVPVNGRAQVLVCRFGTWLTRQPMVVFGHSGLGADDKWNLLCSPDVFVAFSRAQASWARKYRLPWTRIVVIPHAVDTARFFPPATKPRKKIVLCVAANTPDKRVYLVKEAVERLPGFKFVAVGKGSPIQASFEKMPKIYKRADVFCFVPQPWEAFGLVFLEAMASNLPVVTAGDPIRREIVGGAGVLVKNPEDRNKLAMAIELAYKINWGNRPRRQAEKFSWDKIEDKYERLFQSLIK